MDSINSETQIIITPQSVYDAFNEFIFSNDTKVMAKLVARTLLFEMVKNIPGDIIECGVFKGSGILTWLKLKKILTPNAFKKVIGFDFFDTEMLVNNLSGKDKETMSTLFSSRNFKLDYGYLQVLQMKIKEAKFNESEYELIKGDISFTSFDYASKRPGAKISMLYIDVDLEKPTYDTLQNLWPLISNGGIVVFDEYACHQWSESKGADRFANENNLKIIPLNYPAPTAYIQK